MTVGSIGDDSGEADEEYARLSGVKNRVGIMSIYPFLGNVTAGGRSSSLLMMSNLFEQWVYSQVR